MAQELEKTYNPSSFEDKIYDFWMKGNYFHAEADPEKQPYTIVMPPPNITGQLHIGHALDETLQDILIRWKRMSGYCALWLPGTDHASIATEAKIVETMRKEGISKDDLGREKFLERAWEWKREYGGRITRQLRKLGVSCDWSRERFTMDEGCSDAVKEVFVKLYKDGKIYRGNRMVNWCPHCITSISDAEVEYEEQHGHFWHILYQVKETGEMLEIATTRPETMLGDTAVAINAEDERYKHLHGCHVILPLLNKEIPIVCDEHADMEKGTGVVKITPAHDPNDYEVGQRCNLPIVRVFTYDGHMTGAADVAAYEELKAKGNLAENEPEVLDCGKYAGMDTMTARKATSPIWRRSVSSSRSRSIPTTWAPATAATPRSSRWSPSSGSFAWSRSPSPPSKRCATAKPSLFRHALKRSTSTGWKTSRIGAFRVSSGGVTAFLPTTATPAAK